MLCCALPERQEIVTQAVSVPVVQMATLGAFLIPTPVLLTTVVTEDPATPAWSVYPQISSTLGSKYACCPLTAHRARQPTVAPARFVPVFWVWQLAASRIQGTVQPKTVAILEGHVMFLRPVLRFL